MRRSGYDHREEKGSSMAWDWEGKHQDDGWPPAPPLWAITILLLALTATLVVEGVLATLDYIQ